MTKNDYQTLGTASTLQVSGKKSAQAVYDSGVLLLRDS